MKKIIVVMVAALLLTSCATTKQAAGLKRNALGDIESAEAKAAQTAPVVTSTQSAYLLGAQVQVAPPPSPVLGRHVTYHSTKPVSLADVAAWIRQETGLVVDTIDAQQSSSTASQANAPTGPVPTVMPPLPATMGGSGSPTTVSSNPARSLTINYEGPLSGLLDVAANQSGMWWKMTDGRLVFRATETKTFYLPAIARASTGNSQISATTGNTGSSSNSVSSTSGTGSTGSMTSSGGATSTSTYTVDVWADLEKTAKSISGGAQIVVNASVGSISVTGTPAQVRSVEEWTKSLADNLSQQVAITIHVYNVKVTNEDNYSWNPSVIFNDLAPKYGFTLAGPDVPAAVSNTNPLNFTASVLENATGRAAKWSGSQVAVAALSSLGEVTETLRQTVVTLNGQPAPIQVANQLGYLASTTAPVTYTGTGGATVPPSLTPGTLTTGFTAMFLPRIVGGKIMLAMNLTSSTLNSMGSVESGGSSIQTPNVDVSTFQQAVSLTPGDSVLLTGFTKDNGNTSQNGVGTPSFWGLGGGIDSTAGKQMIAIVITAKVV
ncbi:secretin N-terminal domain-containing protein [Desulfobulbus elongatus]|uniref:secretin N-terminal domain-containing protein n=1 Tax=Desulfobulbus elongatus TaxID=53332 RepID=UPI000483FE6A|nr:secretin N-terminal domain-containing protein [Desulfobulbus elongatus]